MVKNDASGNSTGYKAGKSIDLVRNPNWDKSTDYRPAYLDEIFIRDQRRPTRRRRAAGPRRAQNLVARHQPAGRTVLKHAVTKTKDQFVQVPGGGYRYFPLNTTIKPFDNINVRKADHRRLRPRRRACKARGGKFIGDIADALPPAGHPGLRGGRRPDGPRATTS